MPREYSVIFKMEQNTDFKADANPKTIKPVIELIPITAYQKLDPILTLSSKRISRNFSEKIKILKTIRLSHRI